MRPARKIRLDTSKSTVSTAVPIPAQSEANGAVVSSTGTSAAGIIAALSSRGKTAPHETTSHVAHGAVFPRTGPINSVAQLLGRNVAKGAVGSFSTMEEYKAYLNTLTPAQLRDHAIEEARIVPIEDRNRLIRRLEGEYTAFAARTPARRGAPAIPQPKPYSAEQHEKLAALRKQMLRE